MAINLIKQFEKLEAIINGVTKFYWNGGEEYRGPINRLSIVNMQIHRPVQKSVNLLLLAERVPGKYFSYYDTSFPPLGTITANLDEYYELVGYDPVRKILNGLTGSLSSVGTIEGENSDSKGACVLSIIYEPSHINLKGGIKMSRRLEEVEVRVDFKSQPHVATILLLDTSGSMHGDKIDALNEGLRNFKTSVESDELAKMRVDLAVVTFNDRVDVIHNFSSIENFEPSTLSANGSTSMGDAILKAAEMIEERKKQYKDNGVDYYRPWIFMITDGEPTDMNPGSSKWENVTRTVHDGEEKGKFMFFPVAVDPANTDILSQIAPPSRKPVRLKGLAFDKLFEWLSKSLGSGGVSGSKPGEQIPLTNPAAPDGWGCV